MDDIKKTARFQTPSYNSEPEDGANQDSSRAGATAGKPGEALFSRLNHEMLERTFYPHASLGYSIHNTYMKPIPASNTHKS